MCVIKYSKVYTRYDASPFSQNVAVVFIMCVFSGLYLTIDWYWTNSTTRSICLCGLHTLKMMLKRIIYIYCIFLTQTLHFKKTLLTYFARILPLESVKGSHIQLLTRATHIKRRSWKDRPLFLKEFRFFKKKRVSWRDRFTCFTALLSYEGSTTLTCFHGTMHFLTEIMSRRCCIMLHEYSCAFGRGIDSTFWNNCILNVERVYL